MEPRYEALRAAVGCFVRIANADRSFEVEGRLLHVVPNGTHEPVVVLETDGDRLIGPILASDAWMVVGRRAKRHLVLMS